MIYYPDPTVEIRKIEGDNDGLPTIMKIQFKSKEQWQNLANALDDMYEFIAIETYDVCSNETITLVQILDFKDSLKEVGETRRDGDDSKNEEKNSETNNSE